MCMLQTEWPGSESPPEQWHHVSIDQNPADQWPYVSLESMVAHWTEDLLTHRPFHPLPLHQKGHIGILPMCMESIWSVRGLESWSTGFKITHRHLYLLLSFKSLHLHKRFVDFSKSTVTQLFAKLVNVQHLAQCWDSDWRTEKVIW